MTTQPTAEIATPAPVSGFTTIMGVTVNPMVIVLAIFAAGVLWILYKAQRDSQQPFNCWDLIMDAGKASATKITFMSSFVMTTWVIVDLEIKGRLTADLFAAYLLAWVGPLTAKVIFNKDTPPVLKCNHDDHQGG